MDGTRDMDCMTYEAQREVYFSKTPVFKVVNKTWRQSYPVFYKLSGNPLLLEGTQLDAGVRLFHGRGKSLIL